MNMQQDCSGGIVVAVWFCVKCAALIGMIVAGWVW